MAWIVEKDVESMLFALQKYEKIGWLYEKFGWDVVGSAFMRSWMGRCGIISCYSGQGVEGVRVWLVMAQCEELREGLASRPC